MDAQVFHEAIAVLPAGWAPAPRHAKAQAALALALSERQVVDVFSPPARSALDHALDHASAYRPQETFAGRGWMRPHGWEFQDGSHVLAFRHNGQVLCFPWAVVPLSMPAYGETIHPPFGEANAPLSATAQAALDAALDAMGRPGSLYPWSGIDGPTHVVGRHVEPPLPHPMAHTLDPLDAIVRTAGLAIAAAASFVYHDALQHPIDGVESSVDAGYVGTDGRWCPPTYDASVLLSHAPDTAAVERAHQAMESWLPHALTAVDRALAAYAGPRTMRQLVQPGPTSVNTPPGPRWHMGHGVLSPTVLCARTVPPPGTAHARLQALAAAQGAFPGWPPLPM